jgi:hypothetical protein
MIIQTCSTWDVSPFMLPYVTKLEGVVSCYNIYYKK